MNARTICAAALLLCAVLFQACAEEASRSPARSSDFRGLPVLQSRDELRRVIGGSNDRLLLIDFFADWCLPCKQLEPILAEIASRAKDRVDVYRIDIDANRSLADGFQVQGIPYVVFVKNQVIVFKLMGLHPKETYWAAVREFSSAPSP